MSSPADEYDSPWKLVLERFFPFFLAFFFPEVYNDIDWSKGYEFLDQELQEAVRDAELGKRLVDKLVKVWLKNGQESWVLAHIEVQAQVKSDFAKKIFIYNYRIFDVYDRPVASLAVLADERKSWRPRRFGYQLWRSKMGIEFPIVKLLDYANQWEMLESTTNPFGVVVMAHLKTQETRHNPEERSRWKLTLAKMLHERGWSRGDVLELMRFLDWIMYLPEELERGFRTDLQEYEEQKKMPYLTTFERAGIEIGLKQGALQKGREYILHVLRFRFGQEASSLTEALNQVEGQARLTELLDHALAAASLEEFRQEMLVS